MPITLARHSIVKQIETPTFPDDALFATEGWEHNTPIMVNYVLDGEPMQATIVASPTSPETAATLRATGLNVEAEYERRVLLLVDPKAGTIRRFDGKAIPELQSTHGSFGETTERATPRSVDIPQSWGQNQASNILKGRPMAAPEMLDSFAQGLADGSQVGGVTARQAALAAQHAAEIAAQADASVPGFPSMPIATPKATPAWEGLAQPSAASTAGSPFFLATPGGDNAANG